MKNHNLVIIIAVTLAVIGAIVIIHQVMAVQNAFDGYSPKVTVTQMAYTCAERLRESGIEPNPTPVTECVRTMLKELNK